MIMVGKEVWNHLMDITKNNEIMKICLLAGKILLKCGAETYRVEDTMIRIALACHAKNAESLVTPTGIFFSVETNSSPGVENLITTRVMSVSERITDLYKVTLVNKISRKLTDRVITPMEAYVQLKELENRDTSFPAWLQICVASIASGCFLIMFHGTWADFLQAVCVGGIGFISFVYLQKIVPTRFLAEFISSMIIGFTAFICVYMKLGHEVDKIIIGSVMPLVPGLSITNAVRDLMSGHLLSGISKGAEALLTASAVGAGVSIIIIITH